jgi:alpha-amylase
MAVAFLLSWDYGTPKILSSFYFDNRDQGPPHTSNYTIADVTIDSNGTCTNGWICQHRWKPIAAMARFRDVVSSKSNLLTKEYCLKT